MAQSMTLPFHRPQTSQYNSSPVAPATLAHLFELQHQVTVKTLALQSLESEHADLLQKFRRERTRTQALESKASTAECEVNDLTSKYEDAVDHIRSMEVQLEATERKAEAERAQAAREKAQWLGILKQAGQLSDKATIELRQMIEEKTGLSQRISCLETDRAHAAQNISGGKSGQVPSPQHAHATLSDTDDSATSPSRQGIVLEMRLRSEIATHKERIATLRSALEEARRRNEQLLDDAQALWRRYRDWSGSIDSVLEDDGDQRSCMTQPVGLRLESIPSATSSPERRPNLASIHSMLNAAGRSQSGGVSGCDADSVPRSDLVPGGEAVFASGSANAQETTSALQAPLCKPRNLPAGGPTECSDSQKRG
jgi:predicted  nucleic acid-binding Zn-ribbon protein